MSQPFQLSRLLFTPPHLDDLDNPSPKRTQAAPFRRNASNNLAQHLTRLIHDLLLRVERLESNRIGSATRVVGALAVGIAVVIWSEWFRTRGYRIFSFSLKAVGLGVLYLAVWAAFQLYRLIPLQLAFAALILVTAATVVLALCQDAAIVAFFALVGGFATPLLVSSTGQEVQLFTYLLVLDFATLLLAVFRRWPRLLLSLVGALTLYFAGYAGYYRRDELQLTITFATLSSPCSPSRQW